MTDTPKPPPATFRCPDCGATHPLAAGHSTQRGANAVGWPLSAYLCDACWAVERSRMTSVPPPPWKQQQGA